ncbi:MAG TPA: 50S ribosomal protein L15 [Syntrophorhabdaceae bacterium]|mgnify:CR=1 FL=1|jgi:large subunit ribosomal protein L15|nr:50S ribosomal protein L15 [Syntrophorhabdaceae bacterium]HNT68398.1 50S ribosomal protein L15 [Syntrophorhabdaceae bacterium]
MKLSDLKPSEGSIKKRKRVGRGTGSGHGTTATYGNKGQRSTSGGTKKKGFEGGQMPLMRRIPKRGFKNPFRKEYSIIKIGDLAVFKGQEKVGIEEILRSGFIKKMKDGIKLLSDGEIDFPIKIQVHKASERAIEKIKAQGGDVEVLI